MFWECQQELMFCVMGGATNSGNSQVAKSGTNVLGLQR